MDQSTSESLRFSPVAGRTVRAAFGGGALSSDVGPLILRGIDRHHCDLPLFLFKGLSDRFITAALRPGQRPTGAENATTCACSSPARPMSSIRRCAPKSRSIPNWRRSNR